MRLLLILGVLVSSVVVARSTAEACSGPPCWSGHFIPGQGATVPANLPALYWRPTRGFDTGAPDPGKVTLATAANPGTPIGLTPTLLPDGDYLFTPVQPLVAGTSYVLGDGNLCDGNRGPGVTFHAGPAAPLPARLGVLRAAAGEIAALTVDNDGLCSSSVDADQATIELEADPEATPWLAVLHFETWVDGQRWQAQSSSLQNLSPGTSWRGRGVDLVYRTCRSDDPFNDAGLDAGEHTVMMRASLPGTMVSGQTDTVVVELACPGDPSACKKGTASCDDGGGCSAGGARAAPWLLVALVALVARRRRRK